MAEKPKTKVGSHWKRPPTRVYDYNYNVGEHYYKPMMKHLDKRDAGLSTEPPGPKTFAERLVDDPLCCGCKARPDQGCEHGNRAHAPSFPSSSIGAGRDLPSRPRLSDSLDDPLLKGPLDNLDDGAGRGGRNRPSRLNFPSITDEILSSAGLKTPDGFFDDALGDLKKRRPRTVDPDDLMSDPFFAKGSNNARGSDLEDSLGKTRRNMLRDFNGELDSLDSKLDKLAVRGDQSLVSASSRLAAESSSSLNIRKRSVKTTVTSETVRY